MSEILTESFCERCGTRYTFQPVAPRTGRIGRLKVLSKGLRNYVLSDETTLEEALADARSDEEREVSSRQLDAFHQAFNFCMSCRQYTCANCWNAAEGRCLSCAPNLGRDILPAPFADAASETVTAAGNGHVPEEMPSPVIEASAWPAIDLAPRPDEEAELVEPTEAEALELAEAGAHAASRLEQLLAPRETPAESASADEAAALAAPAEGASGEPTAATEAPSAQEVETQAVVVEPQPVVEAAPEAVAVESLAAEPAGGVSEPVAVEAQAATVERQPAVEAAPEPDEAGPEPVAVEAQAAMVEPQPVVEAVPEPVAVEPIAAEPGAAVIEPVGVQPAALAEPQPVVEAASELIEAAPEPVAAEQARSAARQTRDLFARFRPHRHPAAPPLHPAPERETEAAPVPPIADPGTLEAVEATPQPTVEATPQPAVEPAPTPVAAEPPEAGWQVVAPETPAAAVAPVPSPTGPAQAPLQSPLPAEPAAAPTWPTAPTWPSQPARPPASADRIAAPWEMPTPPAGWPLPPQSPAAPSSGPQWPAPQAASTPAAPAPPRPGDIWDASSRDVLGRPGSGVQACVSCGLPLSATARFCRRCGTRQG
ncbi:MAG TPA: hypothetical protein VF763_02035 [Candidatus Limnocylindrales bacterium]